MAAHTDTHGGRDGGGHAPRIGPTLQGATIGAWGAATGTVVGSVVTKPLETVLTKQVSRAQWPAASPSKPAMPPTSLAVARKLVADEGVARLFAGLRPFTAMHVSTMLFRFGSFDFISKTLLQRYSLGSPVTGAGGGDGGDGGGACAACAGAGTAEKAKPASTSNSRIFFTSQPLPDCMRGTGQVVTLLGANGAAGVVIGFAELFVTHPFNTIRMTMQATRSGHAQPALLQLMRQMVRDHGVWYLYRGMPLGRPWIVGSKFMVYGAAQEGLLVEAVPDPLTRGFVSGSLSAALVTMVRHPYEMAYRAHVLGRYSGQSGQSAPNSGGGGALALMLRLAKQHPQALLRGIALNTLSKTLFSGIMFGCYNATMLWWGSSAATSNAQPTC